MIEHIYYIIGILVLLSTISTILKFGKLYSIKEWIEKYEKVVGRKPIKKDYRTKKEYSISESNKILSLFEIVWVIFGLLSSSWYVFLFLIISANILKIFLKPIKWNIIHRTLLFSFLFSKSLLYLYLIINHFFLHKETYDLIVNLFYK